MQFLDELRHQANPGAGISNLWITDGSEGEQQVSSLPCLRREEIPADETGSRLHLCL